jgi:hypothetical protein
MAITVFLPEGKSVRPFSDNRGLSVISPKSLPCVVDFSEITATASWISPKSLPQRRGFLRNPAHVAPSKLTLSLTKSTDFSEDSAISKRFAYEISASVKFGSSCRALGSTNPTAMCFSRRAGDLANHAVST